MADCTNTIPTSPGCWNGELLALALRQGSLIEQLVQNNLALTQAVLALKTSTPSSSSGTGLWRHARGLAEKWELAHRLWRALIWSRLVLWPVYGLGALKWLGWL